MSLQGAQDLLGRPGSANQVLVSNAGNETSGVVHTDAVEAAIDGAVAPLGLDAQPTKRDGLDAADATGNVFVQLFTTFGSFSMAAGILLIFLIFVMLAAERRPEMGMARAVGTQRRHLVQTFLYEGAAYDLMAAAVGAVLGIAISWVMVRSVASAFTDGGLDLSYSVSARSLLIAYAIGVLLTLAVVTASAWRVSRLNIVSAIRDLPEAAETGHRWTRWVGVAAGVMLGAAMAVSGATSQVYLPWMLGVSIVVMSLVPIVKLTGRSERLAYTAGRRVPARVVDAAAEHLRRDLRRALQGLLDLDRLRTGHRRRRHLARHLQRRRPARRGVLAHLAVPHAPARGQDGRRLSAEEPVPHRGDDGHVHARRLHARHRIHHPDGVRQLLRQRRPLWRWLRHPCLHRPRRRRRRPPVGAPGGAWLPTSSPPALNPSCRSRPVRTAPAAGSSGIRSGASTTPSSTAPPTSSQPWPAATTAPQEVWAAMADTPGLAVVDAFVAPRRDQWGFALPPDFQLSGFYIEDGEFAPVPVIVRDPLTDTTLKLTVIGVLSDNTPMEMAGITVSQAVLTPFGERAAPTVHHLAVGDGADPAAVAGDVEAALLSRGVEAETYADILEDQVGANMLFIRLVQGFMALGLVVGVAALGVISARAVVERRQQLGMLRAIGFQPEMIRRALLAETSIVAFTAIAAGTILGLVLSYNVIADSSNQLGSNVTFAVPWLNLALIFAAVIAAALATTLLSAHRATRIYPAEALRYQ